MNLDYKTIASIEGHRQCGSTGVRIDVAASSAFDRNALYTVAADAVRRIEDELVAAVYAASSEAQAAAAQEREDLLWCFDAPVFVEPIPNEYCSPGCCRHLPWFMVTTSAGRIKIGWRKRVIVVVDWSETRGTATAKDLFAQEDTTKGDRMIHAWSLAKAKEYITAILRTS